MELTQILIIMEFMSKFPNGRLVKQIYSHLRPKFLTVQKTFCSVYLTEEGRHRFL
jgi:hypothetical protein